MEYDENGEPIDTFGFRVDTTQVTADFTGITADKGATSPTGNLTLGYHDYLTGDGIPPNGWSVTPSVSFPTKPEIGDYVLRLDYSPNRLFRWDGNMWIKVEDNVRTDLYMDGETQRSRFFNNDATITTTDRGDVPSKQSLSDLLKPTKDN